MRNRPAAFKSNFRRYILGGSPALEAAVEIFYDLNLKVWPRHSFPSHLNNCQLCGFIVLVHNSVTAWSAQRGPPTCPPRGSRKCDLTQLFIQLLRCP